MSVSPTPTQAGVKLPISPSPIPSTPTSLPAQGLQPEAKTADQSTQDVTQQVGDSRKQKGTGTDAPPLTSARGFIRPVGPASAILPKRPTPGKLPAFPISFSVPPGPQPLIGLAALTPAPEAPQKVAEMPTQVQPVSPSPSDISSSDKSRPRPPKSQGSRSAAPTSSWQAPPIDSLPTGYFPIETAQQRPPTLPPPVSGSRTQAVPTKEAPLPSTPVVHAQAVPPSTNAQRTSESLPEHVVATKQAADHWRKSWRDRQRAEAGPATDVSRGQASVDQPLMAMRHSIARMRAIIMPSRAAQEQTQSRNTLRFWITIGLLICLVGGLSAYILYTYLPGARGNTARTVSSSSLGQPTLTIEGSQTVVFLQGQTLHLHGEHFGPHDSITFLLDSTAPVTDAQGRPLTVQANDQGAFDVVFPINSTWLASEHQIQAQDTRLGKSAYLEIQVNLAAATVTNSKKLALSSGNQPIKQLSFTALFGQGNPASQRITLTNTTASILQWSATTTTISDSGWLLLDDNHFSGSLPSGGSDSVSVSVLIASLQSNSTHTGQVIFTINGQEQVILPVTLLVQNLAPEVVVNPNPLNAVLGPGNTCLSGTTLTLINLGNVYVTWNANPFAPDQSHIHLDNQPTAGGTLSPSGLNGDTKVIAVTCINVHPGTVYHITVSYNKVEQDVAVSVRPAN